MLKKRSSPVRALIDLRNHSPPKKKKNTFKKTENPAGKPKTPPSLVGIELEASGQRWVVQVDPRRDMHSILKELTSRKQLETLDRQQLRKQLLSQLQQRSSQPKVEVQPESTSEEQQQERIIELQASDIRFLRMIFDSIGVTKHGSITYQDRSCERLAKLLPADHIHTMRELVLVLIHRRQPARFEDFIFLVCEQGRLASLEKIFSNVLD